MRERIESLDYLRGIFSVSVMIYHFYTHTNGILGSESLLGRLGVYAVSGFFVISGMSMRIAYHDMVISFNSVAIFLKKRFFRLAPIYWIMTFFVILITLLNGNFKYSLLDVFYNLTLLFGVFSPTNYMVVGGWSIGVEVSFYLLFPLIVIFQRKSCFISQVISLILFIAFAFFIIDDKSIISEQWGLYINPFNQLLFFVFGYSFFEAKKIFGNKIILMLGLLSILVFIFYKANGDLINITTELNRVIFSFCIIFLCFSSYFIKIKSLIVSKFFKFLGDISYSLYLTHPFVMLTVMKITDHNFFMLSIIASPLTVLLSFILYKYIEIPFIKYARR